MTVFRAYDNVGIQVKIACNSPFIPIYSVHIAHQNAIVIFIQQKTNFLLSYDTYGQGLSHLWFLSQFQIGQDIVSACCQSQP